MRATLANTNWPDGMTDEEAILRLQSIMISGCEGNKGLSEDRDYKALRVPLIKRPDLADVVPKYVRANRDLGAFWAYIKGYSQQWKPRREHVWDTFRPLFDRIEGKTRPPVQSSRWTGRRTPAQQAQIVLSLAPDALHGVQMLLDEQERAHHNGGPISPVEQDAIDQLKALRDALSELIALAETGQPIAQQLVRLKALKAKMFKWGTDPYGLGLGELPLVASSSVIGCGVMYLVNLLTKGMTEAAAIGASAMAVHAAGVINSRKTAARSSGGAGGQIGG